MKALMVARMLTAWEHFHAQHYPTLCIAVVLTCFFVCVGGLCFLIAHRMGLIRGPTDARRWLKRMLLASLLAGALLAQTIEPMGSAIQPIKEPRASPGSTPPTPTYPPEYS